MTCYHTILEKIRKMKKQYHFVRTHIDIDLQNYADDNPEDFIEKEYFNQDVYTDVIAFNIDEDPFEGELYISYDRVKDNAEKFNDSFEGEFKRILIHGTLHLCGFDDQTKEDKSRMTSMEEDYLKKFNGKILA